MKHQTKQYMSAFLPIFIPVWTSPSFSPRMPRHRRHAAPLAPVCDPLCGRGRDEWRRCKSHLRYAARSGGIGTMVSVAISMKYLWFMCGLWKYIPWCTINHSINGHATETDEDWRSPPYTRPMFQTYVSKNILTKSGLKHGTVLPYQDPATPIDGINVQGGTPQL